MISREQLKPLFLVPIITIIDQMTKQIVVLSIEPIYSGGAIVEILGDFLRFIHARNPGIAFSIGRDLPDPFRGLLFTAVPLLVLAVLLAYYLRTKELPLLYRYAVAGILGGGAGNLIDRLFRPDGVVDFIDVRIYGLLGMERWPTFNVADACVVVSGVLLFVAMLHDEFRGTAKGSRQGHEQP
ncbi:MAG: signal peptidase II [Spirochaeta sp.]|nr:signal peptidase II [Spirochaeta sp.]